MNPITIQRLAEIRQQEILEQAERDRNAPGMFLWTEAWRREVSAALSNLRKRLAASRRTHSAEASRPGVDTQTTSRASV